MLSKQCIWDIHMTRTFQSFTNFDIFFGSVRLCLFFQTKFKTRFSNGLYLGSSIKYVRKFIEKLTRNSPRNFSFRMILRTYWMHNPIGISLFGIFYHLCLIVWIISSRVFSFNLVSIRKDQSGQKRIVDNIAKLNYKEIRIWLI